MMSQAIGKIGIRAEMRAKMRVTWAGMALYLGATGCTIVVPTPDPPKPKVVVINKGDTTPKTIPPLEAHALFVMNLHQSSANLAPYYVTVADALIAGLALHHINVVRWAVVPTYPGSDGLRLLLGAQTPVTLQPIPGYGGAGGAVVDRGGYGGYGGYGGGYGGTSGGLPIPLPAFDIAPTPPPIPTTLPPDLPPIPTLPNGTDVVTALQKLAATGKYDGLTTTSEAEGVVRTGQNLIATQLPAELGRARRRGVLRSPAQPVPGDLPAAAVAPLQSGDARVRRRRAFTRRHLHRQRARRHGELAALRERRDADRPGRARGHQHDRGRESRRLPHALPEDQRLPARSVRRHGAVVDAVFHSPARGAERRPPGHRPGGRSVRADR